MIQLLLFILGAAVGSFLYVVVLRITTNPKSILVGRSKCNNCDRVLVWYELVPLFSYLFLRGRCRTCNDSFSIQYFFVELLYAFIWLLSFIYIYERDGLIIWILWLILIQILLVIAFVDFRELLIPDILLILGFLVAIGLNIYSGSSWIVSFSSAIGCGAFFLIFWLVSKGKWIGFGDVKLASLLGFSFGFPGGVIVIYGAVILGLVIALFLLYSRRATMKTALPFGTLLAISSCFYIFLQTQALELVQSLLFL